MYEMDDLEKERQAYLQRQEKEDRQDAEEREKRRKADLAEEHKKYLQWRHTIRARIRSENGICISSPRWSVSNFHGPNKHQLSAFSR